MSVNRPYAAKNSNHVCWYPQAMSACNRILAAGLASALLLISTEGSQLLLQVTAPGMLSSLTLPLPSLQGHASMQPDSKGTPQKGTMQVHICADSVCSLQVTFGYQLLKRSA